MKKVILLVLLLPSLLRGAEYDQYTDDDIKKRQERILDKMDYLENQGEFSLTGRGMVWLENLKANGEGVNGNNAVRDHISAVQIDLNMAKKIFPLLNIFAGLRFKNDFSGFYGLGDSFEARKIYMETVLAEFLRIKVGDFNQRLTPLTCFAPVPETGLKKGVFNLLEEKKRYDALLTDDAFPLQGLMFDAKFNANLFFDRLSMYASMARLEKTSFQRFFSSAMVDLSRNKTLSVKGTAVNYYDVKQTQTSEVSRPPLSDTVFSFSFQMDPLFLVRDERSAKDSSGLRLEGELAQSLCFTNLRSDSRTVRDYALNLSFSGLVYKNHLALSYLDTGNEFFSPAAQTPVYQITGLPTGYLSYLKGQNLSYHFSDRTYNNQISFYRNWYDPVNNTFPMNDATPNRRGMRLDYVNQMLPFFRLDAEYGTFREIRAMRTKYSRDFKDYALSLEMNPWSKIVSLPELFLKWQNEVITRKDDETTAAVDESEDLKTCLYTLEGVFKITEKWGVLAGFSRWTASGSRWIDFINSETPLDENIYSLYKDGSFSQDYIAGGLKYNMNRNSFVMLYYKYLSHYDKLANDKNYELHFIDLYASVLF